MVSGIESAKLSISTGKSSRLAFLPQIFDQDYLILGSLWISSRAYLSHPYVYINRALDKFDFILIHEQKSQTLS